MKNIFLHIKRTFKGVMFKYIPGMITCAEFENFIDDYLDGTLKKSQLSTFKAHLKLCRECREYLAAYKTTISLKKRVFDKDSNHKMVPNSVPKDLIQAMLSAKSK